MIAIYKRNSPWLLIVIAIILFCSIRSRAEEAGKEKTYLNIMDMQLQMCDLFRSEQKIYRSNKLVAIFEEQKVDKFEQVLISTEDFVVINNLDDHVIAPNWKIGNLYVYQTVIDGSGELYAIQGATVVNTEYDSIVDCLSAYLQVKAVAIDPLEDLSYIGSTKTEFASEIEPFNEYPTPLLDESDLGSEEAGEDNPVVDPVEEPEQNDHVQDPVEMSAEEQIKSESSEGEEVKNEEESVSVEASAEDPVQDQKEVTITSETNKNISVPGGSASDADQVENTTDQTLYSYIAPSQVKSVKSTRQNNAVTEEQSSAYATNQFAEEQSVVTESGNAENASTARTAIDGEQVVDDVTLHNDNVALQIGLWAVGGIAAAMMIVRLML